MHFISFPALYIFLNGKSASLYEHALQWIIDYAASARPTPLQIKWTNFMSDFESGFVPALKAVFLKGLFTWLLFPLVPSYLP